MRKMVYGYGWEHYPEMPAPAGWCTPEERDAYVWGFLTGGKNGGLRPEVVADTLGIPNPQVKATWPSWFYRVYMQVYKEMR